jgi:hypothetical protein
MEIRADVGEPPGKKVELDLQVYFSILKEIQEHIRASDRKAGFFTAANALLVGVLTRGVDQLTHVHWLEGLFMTLAGAGAFLSVGLVMWGYTISFGKLADLSRVYYGRISQEYCNDPKKYANDIRRMTDEEWAGELAAFIVEASVVASRKDRALAAAAWATLMGVCAWAMAVFVIIPALR